MMSVPAGTSSFHFSTRGLPLRECDKSLRELHDRKLVLLRLEPLPDRGVYADMSRLVLPDLGIMSGSVRGLRHLGPIDGDDLFLFLNLSGTTFASDDNNEVTVQGDAVWGRPESARHGLSHPNNVRFIALRLPYGAIAPLVTGIDHAAMQIISRSTGALTLLKSYVGAMIKDTQALASRDLQRLFVTHVHDLAALTLGATRDAAFAAGGRGVRAARLRAIKDDISANLDTSELTISMMAARHGVTTRYIHKLFETEGVTYSQFVMRQRLARVHRRLTDLRFVDRSIASLAYDAGFGDLSHFNRAFRQRYNATPSDVRRR
jgi:AraC-like DNA-binding protein